MDGSIGNVTDDRSDETGRAGSLSIVVITHDEGERVGECLTSIFEACRDVEQFEVVLVDSRSTDGTTALAREFPITILELPEGAPSTPSAGRYVGTKATVGDLVLFVDGDMVLEHGWLGPACEVVRSEHDLAGVDGYLNWTSVDEDREVDVLRGVALYDREALEDVGGFDPHLHAMEDIDLSYRLADAGYPLVRLGRVVTHHPPADGAAERRRRWHQGYYRGRGELFRKYIARPRLFARLAYRTRLYVAVAGWLALGVGGSTRGGRSGATRWVGLTLLGLAIGARVAGRQWTLEKIESTGLVFAGLAMGIPGRHPPAATFPIRNVRTVQTAPGTEDPVVPAA